jgi:hypothetical protein
MIRIDIGNIPANGTTSPWDTAATTIDGHDFHAKSRASAIAKLARSLLEAGIQDQPWEAYRNGKCSMRGRSLCGVAKLTISEPDLGRIGWTPWKPFKATPQSEKGHASEPVDAAAGNGASEAI